MRFAFSDEQEALRSAARRFLEAHSPSTAVRRAMETEAGFDPELWRRIGRELGWASLAIPEAHGGSGLGWVELAAIMEEMGRTLACVPFFSTACMGAGAILAVGTEAQRHELLPGIAAGVTTATVAIDGAGPGVTARRDGDDVVLEGKIEGVVDGHTADLLVVEAGDDWYVVPGGARGVARRALATMDRTRRLAAIHLDGVRLPRSARLGGETDGGVPAARGPGPAARDSVPRAEDSAAEPRDSGPRAPAHPRAGHARALDLARIALAAEQLGGAERCLELSVEYAKVRTQFGRPIGSFQAIRHRLADLLVDVECARSACYWAAWTADAAPDELSVAAAIAKAVCSDAYFRCAAETIQIHGGIGFTWEHDAHLHFKRARAGRAMLGAPVEHRERVAASLGL